MATATLTSPGMGVPVEASTPSNPIGNQHRKSDRTMVVMRRAMAESLDPVFFEAIQSDEADDEGRHLSGHQRQKASDLTDSAFLSLVLMPEVFPTVDLISHPYNGQVDPHDEVGNGQIGDKDTEASQTCPFVDEVESDHKAAHVAHNGQ